jgi:hypothetical protein
MPQQNIAAPRLVRLPRLPVTIHHSDEIAYLAPRGFKPKNVEGLLPYWLWIALAVLTRNRVLVPLTR